MIQLTAAARCQPNSTGVTRGLTTKHYDAHGGDMVGHANSTQTIQQQSEEAMLSSHKKLCTPMPLLPGHAKPHRIYGGWWRPVPR